MELSTGVSMLILTRLSRFLANVAVVCACGSQPFLQAHRLLYHSTQGVRACIGRVSRVIEKKREVAPSRGPAVSCTRGALSSVERSRTLGAPAGHGGQPSPSHSRTIANPRPSGGSILLARALRSSPFSVGAPSAAVQNIPSARKPSSSASKKLGSP